MADNDSLRPALEHYRQQRQKLIEQLRPLEMMIHQLEKDLGETSSVESAPEMTESAAVVAGIYQSLRGAGNSVAVRPDEFFGMSQSDAAKAYLRNFTKAIPYDQLVTALQNGGAKLGGADPGKTLYVSLARNPRKEFVWPSKGYIGLAEFYAKKDSGT